MEYKKNSIIAVGVFISIAAVFGVFVLYPIFGGIVQDHNAVLDQQQELLDIQESKKRSFEFEHLSLQYAEEFLRLESLLVDIETPVSFFRFLDNTALAFGIRIEKSPGNVQEIKEDAWPSFEIRLVGEGLYPNVISFLEKIEHAPYLLHVRALTITESGQEPRGTVEFSLSVKVFVR